MSTAKKRRPNIDYAKLYTKREDGRYQGYYYDLDANGEPIRTAKTRHILCDRDPERLFRRIEEKHTPHVATFAEVCAEWQKTKWEEWAPNSIAAYKPPIRRVLEEFGNEKLADISTKDVTAFLAELADKGYARRTVTFHKNVISMVYEHAIANGLADQSPATHAVMPRNLPQETRESPSDEAVAAVENGLDKPFGLYPFLLRYSGLRRGEALALRYEDIDRKKGLIHVRKTVEFSGGAPYLKEPKSKTSVRAVNLYDVLADAIPLGVCGFLFPSEKDPQKPMRKAEFGRRWDAYCKAIGYTLTPHQLRHAYACLLYEAGVGIKEAQKLLGHANSQITLDVYTHISDRLQDKSAAKVNDFIRRRDCGGDCKNISNG